MFLDWFYQINSQLIKRRFTSSSLGFAFKGRNQESTIVFVLGT